MESFTKRANSGRGASSCEQVADSMSRKKKNKTNSLEASPHPPPLKHPASFLVIYSAVYKVYIKES